MAQCRSITQTRDVQAFAQQVRSHIDNARAELTVSAGDEDGSSVRAFTLQVVDRLKKPWAGRWRFWVYVAAASGGDPSAAGNTVVWTTGAVLQAVTANALYHAVTDDQGRAAFTLTPGAGAATRYLMADIDGQVKEFGPFSWT